MYSTLYKQLKVYVDDILEKDGYYKLISKNNSKICIFFGTVLITYIFLIFLSTVMLYKMITNIPISKLLPRILHLNEDSVLTSYLIWLTVISLFINLFTFAFVFCETKIHLKKPHFTINPIDKSAMTNEVISKMKLNQEIKKTLNDAFKNADDKKDVKNILLNDTNINNNKESSPIIGNLIYYIITLLITIILACISFILLKAQLVLIAIVFLVFSFIIKYLHTDPIVFSDEVLKTYIKDYIMNY